MSSTPLTWRHTLCAAGVTKRTAHHWNKFPLVTRGVQDEFEDTPRRSVADFTIGLNRFELTYVRSTRAHHKLPNAMLRVQLPCRSLWCEAFVVMVMPVDH